MEYTDRLRRLAIHDADVAQERPDNAGQVTARLNVKELALVQLAALVAMGGSVSSYGAYADAAVSAGASMDEIVDVLFGVLSVVGFPRAVAAAPRLALALGYDINGAPAV